MQVSWDQVFAWRMRRQFVDPRGEVDAAAVARRLCGVQAQVTSSAETAVALRRSTGLPGALVAALTARTLVKTWAMRGTLHALPPDLLPAALSLMGSTRTWEKAIWQRNFGASPQDIAAMVDAVGEILSDRILTREELVTALLTRKRFHPLEEQLRSGWGAVLKPLAWQGALCHGPADGNTVTFTNPAHLLPDWPGIPDPETAAPLLITAYLGAYGPAAPETFDAWLTRGQLRKTTVRGWFSELGDTLTRVEVEGRAGYIRTEDADDLAAAEPSSSVHLLGPFDQYVLGPGTADTVLLPGDHRAKVSRTAGWISPLVLVDGRIAGTWEITGDTVAVSMFDNAPAPLIELKADAEHLARALGRPDLSITAV